MLSGYKTEHGLFQEFNSKAACENAIEELKNVKFSYKDTPSYVRKPFILGICIPKGDKQ